MNKRIKQLATEAELELTIETKKFAELIIRECADWIDRQDETRCPYGVDLVEHFGVR